VTPRAVVRLALAGALLACSTPPREAAPLDSVLDRYGYASHADSDPGAVPSDLRVYRERVRAAQEARQAVERKVMGWVAQVAPEGSTRGTGTAHAGRLPDGIQLPREGPGYVVMKHARLWGTWQLLHTVMGGIAEVLVRHPGSAPVVIGDLSGRGGGPLDPHKSHQNGLDADVGYFLKDNRPVSYFVVMNRANLDLPKTLTLIEGLLNTGRVEFILVDRALQNLLYEEASRRGWSEDLLERVFEVHCRAGFRKPYLQHAPGHHTHLHLRVKPV
jgi:hypothetical protein